MDKADPKMEFFLFLKMFSLSDETFSSRMLWLILNICPSSFLLFRLSFIPDDLLFLSKRIFDMLDLTFDFRDLLDLLDLIDFNSSSAPPLDFFFFCEILENFFFLESLFEAPLDPSN